MLNFVACSLYLSSAYFLATATKVVLVTIRVDLDIYPAMTIAYVIIQLISLQSSLVMNRGFDAFTSSCCYLFVAIQKIVTAILANNFGVLICI